MRSFDPLCVQLLHAKVFNQGHLCPIRDPRDALRAFLDPLEVITPPRMALRDTD